LSDWVSIVRMQRLQIYQIM